MTAQVSPVEFPSGDACCRGVHLVGTEALSGPAGRPVVVMAHGLGGTVDSGLEPFGRGLADAGLDVLAFDYRGFGASDGTPRQTVSMSRQVEDYRAAVDRARGLPGVDPARVVLWGVSLSGGHVLEVAARDPRVTAGVVLTPLVDGPAAGRHALRHHRPSSIARSTAAGVRSRVSGGAMMPLVARPGELGALTLDGSYESYTALAGPTWRNEIDASVGLLLGRHRPGRLAAEVRCPLLFQIADFDRSAPPQASAKAAFAARAEVRHYPGDHFDVWPGHPQFDRVLEHQIDFLRRVLDRP